MPDIKYPRGSEWRKWDLQVHTPYSALNNGFGDDFDAYARIMITRAVERRISAIGVTDYFVIEGYKRLINLLADNSRLVALVGPEIAGAAAQILLLPNIELRASVIVRNPDGEDRRVNFHVLFSNEIEPEEIEEHFLRELKFTAEARPAASDDQWSLTVANLQALGAKLKNQHAPFRTRSDLHVGMMNAVVQREHVTDVLERQASRFKQRFLIVFSSADDLSQCSWDGQGHLARKLFVQNCHMIFSANSGTREFGLGKRHPTAQDFLAEFKSRKPCIHGSDAHTYEGLFEPALGRHLWIKAAPTFQGLRQLLYEPESRVHIGDEPPVLSRVKQNATKYMDSIGFERTGPRRPAESWFSAGVDLNHGLVAIIGNKGSGKSALADILALLGNTRSSEYFSFLTKDRFLSPKTRFGQMFRATAHWRSGRPASKLLSEAVDPIEPEAIKYIPQNYLETICSDLKESRESRFYRELMDVIFSHVAESERLGKESLPDLIDYLTNEKEQRASQLAAEISAVNAEIVALEDQLTDAYRKSIEGQLEQRRAELKAHDEAKPPEVREPSQDPQEQEVTEIVRQELANLVGEAQRLEGWITEAQAQLREAAIQIAAADRLLTRIENLERHVDSFYAESAGDGSALGLDTRGLVRLAVNREPIRQAKKRAEERQHAAQASLDPGVPTSLAAQKQQTSAKTEVTRSKLDEPNRLYQAYLHQLAKWTKRRAEIEGSDGIAGSVKGLDAKLAALATVPDRIRQLSADRLVRVREIFRTKELLLADYRKLYSPVQEFINGHPVSQQQGALEFSASIVVDGVERLLEMIHQGKKGSFQGDLEGRERLREIGLVCDFTTDEGVSAFLETVLDHLEHNKRDGGDRPARLRDQLKQGVSPEDVYGFLYGLSYLRPRFELRWRGKPLDQLSPGERGSLLLVFYLLIDKRDVPIIIDQPEENLDNQTIVQMLVPAIKYAKERRQIIIVTHNPNLAVVCDADQVIHAHLDKTEGNRVKYTAGGIEDPAITQLIVDVLEGTKPAFDLRDAKYEILERSA
jgi:energy-coupling factor transporter ATP-binding protein EcfA2